MTRKGKSVKAGIEKKSQAPKEAKQSRPAGGKDLLRKVPKLQKIKGRRGG